jgi:outer membrane protein assembly factor BamB
MRVSKFLSFSVVILLITVVFAGAVTVPVAAQTDTMQYRYNPQHTGDYSPVAGPVPSNGQLLWNYTTGGPVSSSPAVVNGVVYVGSLDNNVYALNATTGLKLWNYTTRGAVIGSPAIVNGVVYASSEDYNIYALNATTGAKLWNYTTKSYIVSSPAVANSVVYVSSDDNNVYALYANNGTELWNYATRGYIGSSSPAVANGVVYVGSSDCNVYALYANNGTKLWNYTTGNSVLSSPAVANGFVYVGSADGNIYALNATTGSKLWSYATGTMVLSSPSSPAVVNGVVYVGGFDGNVYALNADTGTKLWNYTTGSSVYGSPAVANGVVYVGNEGEYDATNNSYNGSVYALNAASGIELWDYTARSYVFSSPAVSNGVVYVGSFDNNIYAIGNERVGIKTALTISAPPLFATNKPFGVNGTLRTTDGTPAAGATIQLQKNVSGTWTNVAGKTATTTATGAYRISTSEPVVGTYQYRTSYAGNATYVGTNSTSVSVKVVSKVSVLNDLVALGNTVSTLPVSAFMPGTRITALTVIGAAEINVGVGGYGGAAATLQTSLLPRTNGCSATGKPDSDDWVRTCAAQGQLYPQVQNLIQELQALQGS